MSSYNLSNLRNAYPTLTSTSTSKPTLTSVLDSSPEPTTTFSGVAPGHALYDTPPPAENQEQEPIVLSQRLKRPRTSTERGSLYAESREKSRERSEKIQQAKSRKSRKPSKSCKSKNSRSRAASDASSGPNTSSGHFEIGENDDGDCGSHSDAEHLPGMLSKATPSVQLTARPAHDPRSIHSSSSSKDPNPISQRDKLDPISSTDRCDGTSCSDNDSDCNPVQLAAELSKYINYDCSSLSTQDIKAILRTVIADQTPAVESSRRKTKVVLSSSQQIKVGGGNHLDQLHTYRHQTPGLTRQISVTTRHGKSKQQKLFHDSNNNSDHEPTTPTNLDSNNPTDVESITELEAAAPPINQSFRPSRISSSPSPLPPSHIPINNEAMDIDLPTPNRPHSTLNTATQDSTLVLEQTLRPQDSVSQQINRHASHIHQWGSWSTFEPTSAQRLPAPSHTLSSHRSASSVSLGLPYGSQLGRIRQPLSQSALAPSRRDHPAPTLTSVSRTKHTHAPTKNSLGILHRHDTRGGPSQQGNRLQARTKAPTQQLIHRQTRSTTRQSVSACKARAKAAVQEVTGSVGMMNAVWARRRKRQVAGGQEHDNMGDLPCSLPGPSVRAPPELLPDDEEAQVANDAKANGKEPSGSKKRKPAARDVFGHERQILTTAKMHLFAYSLVEGPYQTRGTFMQWAADIFEATWRQELPTVPFERPRAQTLQIMVNSMATWRSKIKENLRPVIQYCYEFDKPATQDATINHNLETFRMIHPNRFHCLDFEPVFGHYEGNTLAQGIAASIFNGPTSVGVLFRDFFEPMPLTTVAFILANMQFCIEEWQHGFFQSRDLNTANMLNKYIAHFRGLKEAKAGARGRIADLQEEWFAYGFNYSGALVMDEPYNQPITLRSEIRPDTPTERDEYDGENELDTEAELEPSAFETNAEGRYTARAKGKGRR